MTELTKEHLPVILDVFEEVYAQPQHKHEVYPTVGNRLAKLGYYVGGSRDRARMSGGKLSKYLVTQLCIKETHIKEMLKERPKKIAATVTKAEVISQKPYPYPEQMQMLVPAANYSEVGNDSTLKAKIQAILDDKESTDATKVAFIRMALKWT